MRTAAFKFEAEECRRQAAMFCGKPESAFLLRLAGMFDELARERDLARYAAPGGR